MKKKTPDCTIFKFYRMLSGKKFCKKKRWKTHGLLENNQAARMSSQKKKKNPTELPKLKRNKVLNIWDRANIIYINRICYQITIKG